MVKRELFEYAHPTTQMLIRQWFCHAENHADQTDLDAYRSFFELWISFNAWGACVTDEDVDREMINALASDAPLNKSFLEQQTDDVFSAKARTFASFWPIFSAKAIRRQHLQNSLAGKIRKDRTALLLMNRVKHAPEQPFNPEHPSWEQTLRSVYQVRCNLFHGDKGNLGEDAEIVKAAYAVLSSFIAISALY